MKVYLKPSDQTAQICKLLCVQAFSRKIIYYLSTETYVVGTQKNRLNNYGKENIYNFTLKKFAYLSLWCLCCLKYNKTRFSCDKTHTMGVVQWLRGRVLDSRSRGRGFEPQRRHCVVVLEQDIYPSLVLVQPRKTCCCLTLYVDWT